MTYPPDNTITAVVIIGTQQRIAEMMWADERMGPLPEGDDPWERNYWAILPAERVEAAWMHEPMDATCLRCGGEYDGYGCQCDDLPWGAESAAYQAGL